MIITCPNCATRYDVEEERFLPEGRSVRCAECEESWFVPSPQPIEDLGKWKVKDDSKKSSAKQEPVADQNSDDGDRAQSAAEKEKSRWRSRAKSNRNEMFDDRRDRNASDDAGDDDASFDAVEEDTSRGRKKSRNRRRAEARQARAERPRDSKGRFVKDEDLKDKARDFSETLDAVEDDDDDVLFADADLREEISKRDQHRKAKADKRTSRRKGRSAPRDEDTAEVSSLRDEDYDEPRGRSDKKRRDDIVDADFEDVSELRREEAIRDDNDGEDQSFSARYDGRARDAFADVDDDAAQPERTLGRKLREEKRRATALMRIDDLDPIAERVFNDEFFTALNVQPRELEKAIRKARRRAEARDVNRLTPVKALGWSAWVGAIAATIFVAFAYRDNIVMLFPNTAQAYSAMGIQALPYGLKIEDVRHRIAMSTNGPTIEITGNLTNAVESAVTPPRLQAEAFDASGALLSRWTFSADATVIRVGESVKFTTRAPAPDGVNEVALSFAPTDEVSVRISSDASGY